MRYFSLSAICRNQNSPGSTHQVRLQGSCPLAGIPKPRLASDRSCRTMFAGQYDRFACFRPRSQGRRDRMAPSPWWDQWSVQSTAQEASLSLVH
jgi:hypothetical protein